MSACSTAIAEAGKAAVRLTAARRRWQRLSVWSWIETRPETSSREEAATAASVPVAQARVKRAHRGWTNTAPLWIWPLSGSLLLAAGLSLLAVGVWIPAKAALAQVLLERAWLSARAGHAQARPWPWADTFPVARLSAPRLGRSWIVLAGASGRTLAFAPGHLDGTPLPGDPGNAVIAGHRDTHFAGLASLAVGDELVVETPRGRSRSYRVVAAAVLDHRDTRVLESAERDALTLVTCFPFDTPVPGGPLRYVVRAEAV